MAFHDPEPTASTQKVTARSLAARALQAGIKRRAPTRSRIFSLRSKRLNLRSGFYSIDGQHLFPLEGSHFPIFLSKRRDSLPSRCWSFLETELFSKIQSLYRSISANEMLPFYGAIVDLTNRVRRSKFKLLKIAQNGCCYSLTHSYLITM